jgi:hypothetical protein
MGSASKYWRLVRLDATGRRRVEAVAIAQAFFRQQFPEWAGVANVPDAMLQRQLLELWRAEPTGNMDASCHPAELCLRCYISSQIEQVCLQLEAQFGVEHGFTAQDLLPMVLDDEGRWSSPPTNRTTTLYRSLATEILQTFDPNRASLSTWVIRLVRHHKELNAFLLEQGVYLVSDWAILNDTTYQQLQRILSQFYAQTPTEIAQAQRLLHSYHQVYRSDRLQHRQTGGRGQCAPPTPEQLHRIAQIDHQTGSILSAEAILSQLQSLASQLRQYRIYVRSGKLPAESLDQPEIHAAIADVQPTANQDPEDEQNEFLAFYREQFLHCLDTTMQQVVSDRLSVLQQKSPPMAQQFLQALQLFHCRGQSMSEIANQIGLKAQYQVTRLMKLKEFRADIRQRLLITLSDRILEKAKTYADPDRLHNLDQQLEAALDEQISRVLQEAEAEASIAKHRSLDSLFARRLCHQLDSRRIEP